MTKASGGVRIDAQDGDVRIGGDVVGRDKVIQHIHLRTVSAAKEAARQRSVEAEALANGVGAYVQRLQAPVARRNEVRTPYRGLLEYRFDDAAIFLGRDQAIHDLGEIMTRGPLTVLHSESGAGKTSLLQAGIAPRLIDAEDLPVYVRPYNADPQLAIKRAFVSDLSQTPILAAAPLRDFLQRVVDIIRADDASTRLYIFLDQFEEFFVHLDTPRRIAFVDACGECLDDPNLNVRWVLALRTESFGNLADFRPRIHNPFENDYRLNVLTRDEARQVIAEPARQRGILYEEGLIDALLNDLGQSAIAPPQIQLVCSALYEELEPGETTITRLIYQREGCAAGILRGHLERVLGRDIRPEQRTAAWRLLESLVTSNVQRVIRSRDELITELARYEVSNTILEDVLAQLVDSRLLRTHETDAGPTYELAHDYLLNEIKLDPEVAARKAAQELLEQEVYAYRRFRTLIDEDRLKIIEPLLKESTLTPEARGLIAESQTKVQRKQRAAQRRQQWITRLAVGAAIVFLALAGLAIVQRNLAQSQARLARAGQLATESQAALNRYPQRSVLLAAEGLSLTLQMGDNEHPAENALRSALTQIGGRVLAAYDAYGIDSMVVSPDGRWLGILASFNLHLWRMSGGPGGVRSFGPSSSRVGESTIDTPEQVVPAEVLSTTHISAIVFDPDSRWLVARDWDGQVLRWDLSDLTTSPISFTRPCANVYGTYPTISQDGRWMITAGNPSNQDAKICLWPFPNWAAEPIVLSSGLDGIDSILTTGDGRWLIVARDRSPIHFWKLDEIQSGAIPIVSSVDPDSLGRMALSGDSHWLATVDHLNVQVRLWDLASSVPTITKVFSATSKVRSLAISSDSRWLFAAGFTGELMRWSLKDLTLPAVVATDSDQSTEEIVGSDTYLVGTAEAYFFSDVDTQISAKLWSVRDLQASSKPIILRGHENAITAVAIEAYSSWVATGSKDGSVRLWDLNATTGVNVTAINPLSTDWWTDASLFSGDGHWLYTRDTLLNLRAENPLTTTIYLPRTGVLHSVTMSADSHWLAALSDRGMLQIWDLTSSVAAPQQSTDLKLTQLFARNSAISSDRRWFAAVLTDTVRLWDLNKSDARLTPYILSGHDAPVRALALSADNHWLVTVSDRDTDPENFNATVILWNLSAADPSTESMVLRREYDDIGTVAISADGRWLVAVTDSSSSDEVQVWDLKAADPVQQTTHMRPTSRGAISDMAISADGRLIVVGSTDNNLYLLERRAGDSLAYEQTTLQGHTAAITAIAISADEHWLVSASKDETARLWDLTGKRRTPVVFYGHQYAIDAVAISANNRWIITGGIDGIYLWSLRPGDLIDQACRTVGRNLTEAEWAQYFPDEPYRLTCPALPPP